jgi:hypothetical protein
MKRWVYRLPPDACDEAIKWCRAMPDFETAWRSCQVGSWMEWLLDALSAWPADAGAKFDHVETAALAKYGRETALARDKCRRVRDTEKAMTWARTAALAEYERAKAEALRPYMPKLEKWTEVAQAIEEAKRG